MIAIGFTLLVTLAAAAADEAPAELTKFTSDEGRFTALFLGEPQRQEVSVGDPADKTAVQVQFGIDTKDGAYMVSYQDNPGLAGADAALAEAALQRGQEAVGKTFAPGKLLLQKSLKLQNKHPGREFTYAVPQGDGIYRSRLYLVDGRLYQVIVVGTKAFANSEQSNKVLQSFSLKP